MQKENLLKSCCKKILSSPNTHHSSSRSVSMRDIVAGVPNASLYPVFARAASTGMTSEADRFSRSVIPTLRAAKAGYSERNVKAFTLIELLVVVLIIGILAAAALPQYEVAVVKSRLATIRPVLASIKQAQEVYFLENGKYSNDVSDLDVDLSTCTPASDVSTCLVCGSHFMIDSLAGSNDSLGGQTLRAAYCPGEIKGDKKWMTCAYDSGDFVYTVWLTHSSYPDRITCTALTDLGRKICKGIN